jgi:hypothetical protein
VQEKQEKIAYTKPQVKHQIFIGPITKTQLLNITKHYVIAFHKKTEANVEPNNLLIKFVYNQN